MRDNGVENIDLDQYWYYGSIITVRFDIFFLLYLVVRLCFEFNVDNYRNLK